MASEMCGTCGGYGFLDPDGACELTCFRCRGTGWVPDPAIDVTAERIGAAWAGRFYPGCVVFKGGARHVVADAPWQKGLKAGEVAAWREGFDDPSPVVLNESEVTT